MGEAGGGQWDREGLGDVATEGDGGDKPVGSSGKKTKEVMLLTPCLKPSHVPLGSSVEKLQISFRSLRDGPSRKAVC